MVSNRLSTSTESPSDNKFETTDGLFTRLGFSGVNREIDLVSYLLLLPPEFYQTNRRNVVIIVYNNIEMDFILH